MQVPRPGFNPWKPRGGRNWPLEVVLWLQTYTKSNKNVGVRHIMGLLSWEAHSCTLMCMVFLKCLSRLMPCLNHTVHIHANIYVFSHVQIFVFCNVFLKVFISVQPVWNFQFWMIDLAAGVKAEGSGEMAQWVSVPTVKPDYPSLIPSIWIGRRETQLTPESYSLISVMNSGSPECVRSRVGRGHVWRWCVQKITVAFSQMFMAWRLLSYRNRPGRNKLNLPPSSAACSNPASQLNSV